MSFYLGNHNLYVTNKLVSLGVYWYWLHPPLGGIFMLSPHSIKLLQERRNWKSLWCPPFFLFQVMVVISSLTFVMSLLLGPVSVRTLVHDNYFCYFTFMLRHVSLPPLSFPLSGLIALHTLSTSNQRKTVK